MSAEKSHKHVRPWILVCVAFRLGLAMCAGSWALALGAQMTEAESRVLDGEIAAARAARDRAFDVYTRLVTTGGEGNVEEALRNYRESVSRYNQLRTQAAAGRPLADGRATGTTLPTASRPVPATPEGIRTHVGEAAEVEPTPLPRREERVGQMGLSRGLGRESDEDEDAVDYVPPLLNLPKIPMVALIDVNAISRMQYAGMVSMAMEGMRLVLGEMTEEQQKHFEAQWLPLFGHPNAAVADYLNRLNPLIVEFLALRQSMLDAIETYNATMKELFLAVAEEDVPLAVAIGDGIEMIWLFYEGLHLQMEDVVDRIVELGDPPAINLDELRRRHRRMLGSFLDAKPDPLRIVTTGLGKARNQLTWRMTVTGMGVEADSSRYQVQWNVVSENGTVVEIPLEMQGKNTVTVTVLYEGNVHSDPRLELDLGNPFAVGIPVTYYAVSASVYDRHERVNLGVVEERIGAEPTHKILNQEVADYHDPVLDTDLPASGAPSSWFDQDQGETEDWEKDAQQSQTQFHEANIAYFRKNLEVLNRQISATMDPDARNEIQRSILVNEANIQQQRDYITSLRVGQFVRTRTELDALNMELMLAESERMAEEARTINRVFERVHRLIGMGEPEERKQLWDFFNRHVGDKDIHEYTAEDARNVARIMANRILGEHDRRAAVAEDEALAADDRLQRAKNLQDFCDNYLKVCSVIAPYHYANTVSIKALRGAKKARAAYMYSTYEAMTGFRDEGFTLKGLQTSFTRSATGFVGAYSEIGWVAGKAKSVMESYHKGVVDHLEAYAADPENHTLSENWAGTQRVAWDLGKGFVTDKMKDFAFKLVLPEIPIFTPEWSDVSVSAGKKAGKGKTFTPPKWPTIQEQLDEAQMKTRQSIGRTKVSLFKRKAEALAKAGQEGASREKILELRDERDAAYIAVKTDYFSKAHMNKLGRQGEKKLLHYYQSSDRAFQKQLEGRLDQKMREEGFGGLQYKAVSNSSSRGKVGMDMDLGIVEPPRYLTDRIGKRRPNPAHDAWRKSLSQTMPDGTTVRRRPEEVQAAGQILLQEAFEEIYGRPPGEAMVSFTSTYHPEAYRDTAWLGAKGSKTALVHLTDPAWVQQAADVTSFKIHHMAKDQPGMGKYGVMQENCRGLVKDFDTKIKPMIDAGANKNPKAAQHIQRIRDVMDMFAKDQIGPVQADHKIRELTGGYGVEEVAGQMSVLMQGLSPQLKRN